MKSLVLIRKQNFVLHNVHRLNIALHQTFLRNRIKCVIEPVRFSGSLSWIFREEVMHHASLDSFIFDCDGRINFEQFIIYFIFDALMKILRALFDLIDHYLVPSLVIILGDWRVVFFFLFLNDDVIWVNLVTHKC
jgi:hypothetical protein